MQDTTTLDPCFALGDVHEPFPIEITWVIFKSFLGCCEYNLFRLVSKKYKLFVTGLVKASERKIDAIWYFSDILDKIIYNSGYYGYHSLLKWCKVYSKKSYHAYYGALNSGNEKTLNWLEKNQYSIKGSRIPILWSDAINGGKQSIIWMEERYSSKSGFIGNLFYNAASIGSIKSIEWLLKQDSLDCSIYSEAVFSTATKKGHLHILKWFNENDKNLYGIPSLILNGTNWLNQAGENDHFHIIEWFLKLINDSKKENPLFIEEQFRLGIDINGEIDSLLKSTCISAAKFGQLEFIKKMYNLFPSLVVACFGFAARCGHLHILKWGHELGLLLKYENQSNILFNIDQQEKFDLIGPKMPSLCECALKKDLEMLNWLQEIGFKFEINDRTVVSAVMNGFVSFLESINIGKYQFKTEPYLSLPSKLVDIAICNNQLGVLILLFKNGYKIENNIYKDTLDLNMYHIFKWLVQNNGVPKDLSNLRIKNLAFLIEANELETLQIFNKQSMYHIVMDVDYCAIAAKCNNIKILKLLRQYNFQWTAETTTNAASRGYLEILEWCINNGCPFNDKILETAAKRGHLNIVKWIIKEMKLEPTVITCNNASRKGHVILLEWLLDNRYIHSKEEIIKYASLNGQIHILESLLKRTQENESNFGSLILSKNGFVCVWASIGGHLKTLKWALKVGCSWHPNIAYHTKYAFHRIYKWMAKHGYNNVDSIKEDYNRELLIEFDNLFKSHVPSYDYITGKDHGLVKKYYFFHQPLSQITHDTLANL